MLLYYNLFMNLVKELWTGIGLTLLFFVITSILMLNNVSQTTTMMITPTIATPTQIQPRGSDDEENGKRTPTKAAVTLTPTTAPVKNQAAPSGYSATDVAKHSTQSNCWLIIGNGVYNVTNYLFTHPGGANQIIPYCGADATTVFDSVGKHGSSRTQTDLSSVYIGPLK
jgi:cytochrome b involved in lipid metabolism